MVTVHQYRAITVESFVWSDWTGQQCGIQPTYMLQSNSKLSCQKLIFALSTYKPARKNRVHEFIFTKGLVTIYTSLTSGKVHLIVQISQWAKKAW